MKSSTATHSEIGSLKMLTQWTGPLSKPFFTRQDFTSGLDRDHLVYQIIKCIYYILYTFETIEFTQGCHYLASRHVLYHAGPPEKSEAKKLETEEFPLTGLFVRLPPGNQHSRPQKSCRAGRAQRRTVSFLAGVVPKCVCC